MKNDSLKKNSQCVHAGNYVDKTSLGVNTPIYASTAHVFPNEQDIIRYPRSFNIINQNAVADKICALEGGEAGMVFSSGMAAITTVLLSFLKSGKHAIFQNGLYGGTQHFINTELERYGIEKEIIPTNNVDDYTNAIKNNTVLIYVESPTNPLMDVIDLQEIAEVGSERNILTIIDNTFATPINQNPLDLGFDIVIHSGTKYLNGHSDVCCGAVVCSKNLMEKISETARNHGGVLDAHACYLLERGLKTLGIRVEQHNKNALRIAEFLNEHPKVKKVYYPGLPEHPGHEIAKQQMCGFGGMLSFELDCPEENALEFVNKLELIVPAVSLGGIETILCFPAKTSHAELSADEREKQRISDSLIRLSVGIEDVEDLIADLENAFSAISF
jgi:cystathionine beta-lyase